MKRVPVVVCAVVLAMVIAIYFAQPILDGDLFFHMAYARQMLERHTLIPDHTQFSWTPASNRTIYCAWASELFLYGLWQSFGSASMFVLRYLVVLAVVALMWRFARRTGRAFSPLTGLVLLVAILASVIGTLVKPELFSFLFFHVLVWIYFRSKLAARTWYAAPLLLAVWANVHGAFVLAAPFLMATGIGEILNRRLSPRLALPRPALARLLAAWALCGPAILLTPYGWQYPKQLFADLVLSKTRPDLVWNDAHQRLFSTTGWDLHLTELLFLMVAMLAAAFVLRWRREQSGGRIDWAVLLANLAYVPLYLVYLRTTFFWPVVFAYSVWFVLPAPGVLRLPKIAARASAAAAAVLSVVLGAVTILQASTGLVFGAWLGFGTGYVNPVAEAEYLAKHQLSPKLYNMFDSGAYLIWRLFPQYKVMTDARSFPYLDWFQDQYDFSLGRTFEKFIRKYPADTAMIALLNAATWRHFAESPDWRVVYYGPTGVVFVRRQDRPDLRLADADWDRFRDIRNGSTALRVFDFAVYIGDYATAWRVLDTVEHRLLRQTEPDALAAARAYRAGHRGLSAGNYGEAADRFDLAFQRKHRGPRDRLIHAFLLALERAQGRDTAAIAGGLQRLAAEVR